MLDDLELLALGDVHPLLLLLEDLGDRAALDAVPRGDVLLAGLRVGLGEAADGLAVDVVETSLARARDATAEWCDAVGVVAEVEGGARGMLRLERLL